MFEVKRTKCRFLTVTYYRDRVSHEDENMALRGKTIAFAYKVSGLLLNADRELLSESPRVLPSNTPLFVLDLVFCSVVVATGADYMEMPLIHSHLICLQGEQFLLIEHQKFKILTAS